MGWWWWVAHVIIVSAQVLLVLTLGLWTLDLGLTIIYQWKNLQEMTVYKNVIDSLLQKFRFPLKFENRKQSTAKHYICIHLNCP